MIIITTTKEGFQRSTKIENSNQDTIIIAKDWRGKENLLADKIQQLINNV